MLIRSLLVLCLVMFSNNVFAGALNINLASEEQISKTLQGIGPSKAAAIVQFRNENGPFKTFEDLLNVKGVGTKLVAKIKPHVIFEIKAD